MCTASAAAIRNSSAVFQFVVSSLDDFDIRPMLRKLDVSALVIEGAKTIVRLDSTRESAKAPPDARLLSIPDAGHACFVDQTDACSRRFSRSSAAFGRHKL
jgi:pimeloyl-ACP methyl ester carboxylesterase